MDISVIILTWNSNFHIKKCIPTIISSLEDGAYNYEIIVIDNGSTDGSCHSLQELSENHCENLKVISLTSNRGTTYSRNIGLKQARGDYIAVLDSDVEIPNGIFQHLISKLQSDSSFGLIAPKLVYPSGSLQKSTDQFPTVLSKLIRLCFLKSIEKAEEKKGRNEVAVEVDYVISAFWLFPRKILQDVGYLDEKIFYAPEDVDYCLRIWKKGFVIIYEPKVSSIHYAQEISRGFAINRAVVEHVKGLVYFFAKHEYWLKRPRFNS